MTTTPTPSVEAMREALPCQMCGGKGFPRRSSDGDVEWVRCCWCGHEGPLRYSLIEAVAAWNVTLIPSAGVTIPAGWRLVPHGEPVSLAACPPGPFAISTGVGFKTEYGAMSGKDVGCGAVEWAVTQWPDAYCLDSGEHFWGGASTKEARAALTVQPLRLFDASEAPPVSQTEGLRDAAAALLGRFDRGAVLYGSEPQVAALAAALTAGATEQGEGE